MGVQQILHQITVQTPGRGFTRLDGRLNTWIRSTGLDQGVLHLTCLHTSASLSIKFSYKNRKKGQTPVIAIDLQVCKNGIEPIPVRFMSSSRAINIEGKREVRVSADVDRQLAQRVDAVAKASNSTRAEVVRAALRKL